MIPVPVVERFLRDLSKGSYTGYTDLSIVYRPLLGSVSRKALGLVPEEDLGVLVTDVHEGGAADGYLRKGDVILSIEGHPVACNGRVDFDGQSVELAEVVERKLSGEKIGIGILRDGKPLSLDFPLSSFSPFRMQANAYDTSPRYLLHGGLLFQPLDRNFMDAGGKSDPRIRRVFDDYAEKHLYRDHPEVVVLSRVLADEVNKDCDGLHPGIVETVNGKKINRLSDLKQAFGSDARFDVIRLEGKGIPIVLDRAEVKKSEARILSAYGIQSPSFTVEHSDDR
jgi:hypothetical protein